MMETSRLLRTHIAAGTVIFGVNHEMRDFSTGRKKDLDLVIARPGSTPSPTAPSLEELAHRWNVVLTDDQQRRLSALPVAQEGPVGSVLVALEAKACMTAHIKALPRLYDELSSSHLTVHGASEQALAGGFVMINASGEFLSSDLNRRPITAGNATVSHHRQPEWAIRTLGKVAELPRRSGPGQVGFDALGVLVVDMRNDGGPVGIATESPGLLPGQLLHYDSLVHRLVHQYDVLFSRL